VLPKNLVCNERPGINKIEFIICYICHSKIEIDSNASKENLSLGLYNISNKIK
jgi:hypothetical protein